MAIFNGPASAIEDNRNKVNEINEQSTEQQYPSALAMYNLKQQINDKFANAIKGTASGGTVFLTDVSPLQHNIDVKLSGDINTDTKVIRSGKNLLDLTTTKPSHNNDTEYVRNGNSFTLRGNAGSSAANFDAGQLMFPTSSTAKINETGVPIKKDKTYTVSFDYLLLEKGKYSSSIRVLVYKPNLTTFTNAVDFATSVGVIKRCSLRFTATEDTKAGLCFRVNNNYVTISNIQIEEGNKATEYEDYVEPVEVTPNEDGTLTVPSVYPTTVLTTNTEGVTINAEYNKDTNKIVGDLQKKIMGVKGEPIINALDVNDEDVVLGSYATGNNQWITDPAWNESGYIPVSGNRAYCYLTTTKAYSSSTYVLFFDSQKNYIGKIHGGANPNVYYELPNNTAYIRLPFKEERRNSTLVFFTNDTDNFITPDEGFEYVPYGEVIFYIGANEDGLINIVDDLQKRVSNIETSHWNGLQWYAYGTSLTSEAQGKYVPFVAELSGLNVTNKGIAGGGIVRNTNVKNAVMNITDGKINADLITLEVGANDILAELGTIYDVGDDTFCGALNQCIRYLQENTNAQIVVISSTISRTNPLDYKYATDQHTHFDQKKATEDVCKLNGVYYIPMGEQSGVGGARLNDANLVDNIHHTEIGGYNLAQFVWSKLKNIPLWYTEVV